MREVNPVEALEAFVSTHQTQREAAKALGISQAYLSDLLNTRRDVSEKILARLGLRQIVVKE